MKKRIAMMLGLLMMAMLTLSACGTDPKSVDYNGYTYNDLKNRSDAYRTVATSLADFFKQNQITEDMFTEEERQNFIAGNDLTEAAFDAAFRWMDAEEEAGAFRSEYDDSFSVSKAGNTLTTTVRLKFEKRDVDFQVVYTYYNMKVSGVTIDPVYSLPEKLGKAGINTIISILIVFAVLVLISLLIACFNIFPYLEKKKAAQMPSQAVQKEPVDFAVNEIEPAGVQEADDTELVAVIAAAVAASSGGSVSDFVVRSIIRRK